MPNLLSSILTRINMPPDKQLNILTAPTHERYETLLCETGHNFYSIQHPSFKKWNNTFGQIPNNYYILIGDTIETQIKTDMVFDLILSQNKFGQYQILHQLARQLTCPLISLEHTLPMPQWNKQQIDQLSQMRGDINIFISNYSIEQWQFNNNDPAIAVIEHGVNTTFFNKWTGGDGKILTVVNDYINRNIFCGFDIWQEITKELPVNPIGDTPKLSQPAKDINHLRELYRKASVFLNTSVVSPVPSTVLEAMSCIPEGQKVFFNFHPMNVEDILPLQISNQTLLSNKINKKFVRKYDGEIIKIKANYIPQFITTANHPIATINVTQQYDKSLRLKHKNPYKKIISSIKYISADCLKIDDYLVIPKFKQEKSIGLTEEWLRFYGLYVADGCCSAGYIDITLNEDETDLIEEVCCFARNINANPHVYKPDRDSKTIRVRFYHGSLSRSLLNMFHHECHMKNIPPEIMLATQKEIQHFINGYIDGDGYRNRHNNKKTITFSTVSETLAYQLFLLLTKLNILSTWNYTGPRTCTIKGKTYPTRGRYQIAYTPKHDKSAKLYLEDDDNFYVRIKNITNTHYNGNVYNFNTNNGTYCAPFAMTHNCGVPVVSTATCAIPSIIQDGINGYISNNPMILRQRLKELLKDQNKAKELGQNARQTIIDRFGKDRFIKEWNDILWKTAKGSHLTWIK